MRGGGNPKGGFESAAVGDDMFNVMDSMHIEACEEPTKRCRKDAKVAEDCRVVYIIAVSQRTPRRERVGVQGGLRVSGEGEAQQGKRQANIKEMAGAP